MTDDLISREDAIEVLTETIAPSMMLDTLVMRVNAIPSAQPKQGEWIRISSLYSLDRTYRCSVCGKVIEDMPMDEYYDPAYKGCPYCLARMKGADDE